MSDIAALITSLILSLSLTIIIELSLCIPFFVLKKIKLNEIKNLIIVNVLTNPIVVYTTITCTYFLKLSTVNLIVVILEILVVLVEGLLLKKLLNNWGNKAFLLALYMNAISFGMSFLI